MLTKEPPANELLKFRERQNLHQQMKQMCFQGLNILKIENEAEFIENTFDEGAAVLLQVLRLSE